MKAAAISVALMTLAASANAREPLQRVQFVGCPSDGQAGPIAAPKAIQTPAVSRSLATKLAYYVAGDGPGVLAPRDWHCFGVYGSNGSTLIVTPEKHQSADFFGKEHFSTAGPIVESSYTLGGTSGRFGVADVIARFFPKRRSFIRDVRKMGFELGPLPSPTGRRDLIRRRVRNFVRFTDPAGRQGWGTRWYLTPGKLPVESIVKLIDDPDGPDALEVNVRLPHNLAALTETILTMALYPK